MKYYLDITLLPDAEANLGFLWQKVYQQLHLALVENKVAENRSAIAISFPKYGDKAFPLGDKVRLFAEKQEQLIQLDIGNWLNRLTDYVHYTSIKNVPEPITKYVCFKRKQFKSTEKIRVEADKWAPKLAKKLNKPLEDVLTRLNERKYEDKFTLPFINMMSLSSKQELGLSNNRQFKLFIEKKVANNMKEGVFNCYGLSFRESEKTATVPWF